MYKKMSLGFVNTVSARPPKLSSERPHFQEPLPNVKAPPMPALASRRTCRRYDLFVVILLLFQSAFNFFGFAWVGLVLKWPIVYGDMSHSHPHLPEEDYIWRPNNYINILMTAFAIDLFEPLWLLVMYCRIKGRREHPRSCTYGCCTGIFFFYSFLCILLVGALCATCIPVIMSARPPDLHPCNSTAVHHDTIFQLGDLVVLFVTVFCVALIKLVSYWLSIPQIILLRKFPSFYPHLSGA